MRGNCAYGLREERPGEGSFLTRQDTPQHRRLPDHSADGAR